MALADYKPEVQILMGHALELVGVKITDEDEAKLDAARCSALLLLIGCAAIGASCVEMSRDAFLTAAAHAFDIASGHRKEENEAEERETADRIAKAGN